MDGKAFRVCVRDVLASSLRPSDAVVLDNRPSLKVTGIQEAKAARQAQVFFSLPYSPDLSTVEMAFAKHKTCSDGNRPEPSMSLLPASEACSRASSQMNARTSFRL